jgi:hypothetical protein
MSATAGLRTVKRSQGDHDREGEDLMSEFEDTTYGTLDEVEPFEGESFDSEPFEPEPFDAGPDQPIDLEPIEPEPLATDLVEQPGVDALPEPPPPPVTDGSLPPQPNSGGGPLGEAPMPPIGGDVTTPPPATGEIDLGEGPPLPPDAPAVDADPGVGPQSPVPDMAAARGTVSPSDTTDDLPTDVDLGDGGPPMPPGLEATDTTTAPPQPVDDAPVDLPVAPGDDSLAGPETPGSPDPAVVDPSALEEVVLAVDPGSERVAAAAVAGVLLDQMGADEPARQELIALLEAAGQDGSITVAEVEGALLRSGMQATPAQGTEQELIGVLSADQGRGTAVVAAVPEEGAGVFTARYANGAVELESLRSGSTYSAAPSEVARVWRDSGATLLGPPAPPPPAPADPIEPLDAEPAAASESADPEEGGGLRNVFLAGAVLLPLAGGATYMATRKIR